METKNNIRKIKIIDQQIPLDLIATLREIISTTKETKTIRKEQIHKKYLSLKKENHWPSNTCSTIRHWAK